MIWKVTWWSKTEKIIQRSITKNKERKNSLSRFFVSHFVDHYRICKQTKIKAYNGKINDQVYSR